jgi:hypothetical protein
MPTKKEKTTELEACQIPNHPLVDVGKGHLSVAAIHDDVKDDPVERDKPLEVVGVNELGDVLPYFARKGRHRRRWQWTRAVRRGKTIIIKPSLFDVIGSSPYISFLGIQAPEFGFPLQISPAMGGSCLFRLSPASEVQPLISRFWS